MKTLIQIIEAEPVPGFKPATPARPKGPARPAKPARIKAKVMTPKGRVTTVRKPSSLRKPGYGMISYQLPDGEKPSKPDQHDRFAKRPKKPIKPVSYGRTITEMRITKFEVQSKKDQWSDSGSYPSGAGQSRLPSHSYDVLKGYVEVEGDDPDQIQDFVYGELVDEFGKEAVSDVRLSAKKIGSNKYRVDLRESSMKTLTEITKEAEADSKSLPKRYDADWEMMVKKLQAGQITADQFITWLKNHR